MPSQFSTKMKKIIKKIYKLTKPKYLVPKNEFSEKNLGIINRLKKTNPRVSLTDKEKYSDLHYRRRSHRCR